MNRLCCSDLETRIWPISLSGNNCKQRCFEPFTSSQQLMRFLADQVRIAVNFMNLSSGPLRAEYREARDNNKQTKQNQKQWAKIQGKSNFLQGVFQLTAL